MYTNKFIIRGTQRYHDQFNDFFGFAVMYIPFLGALSISWLTYVIPPCPYACGVFSHSVASGGTTGVLRLSCSGGTTAGYRFSDGHAFVNCCSLSYCNGLEILLAISDWFSSLTGHGLPLCSWTDNQSTHRFQVQFAGLGCFCRSIISDRRRISARRRSAVGFDDFGNHISAVIRFHPGKIARTAASRCSLLGFGRAISVICVTENKPTCWHFGFGGLQNWM